MAYYLFLDVFDSLPRLLFFRFFCTLSSSIPWFTSKATHSQRGFLTLMLLDELEESESDENDLADFLG